MELRAWVNSLAEQDQVEAAARRLGEKPRTVLSWLRCERAPSIRAAINIVQTSDEQVDFNGIYQPFLRAAEAGHARF